MNILVTAGNTTTPIDRVRCITNIFSGRTGTQIALTACERGHAVTLLTSHPEVVSEIRGGGHIDPALCASGSWRVITYRTFDDLDARMSEFIPTGQFDAIVHAAAVSDYRLAGIYSQSAEGLKDASAGKVKSHHAELWLRLLPTPKLIDKIRTDWGFRGKLVKFKLEVGVSEAELLEVAERSRLQSRADLMAANTLEAMNEWAYVGAGVGGYRKVPRDQLAEHLLDGIGKRC